VESPFLTGLGLAGPAGLNAYIPLLVLAIADRTTSRIDLAQPYDFISSTWGILILLALLTVELVVDKIPGIDHANDLLQSVVRPAAGAVLIMAVTNEQGVINPVVAMLLGLGTAGAVHAVKTVSRPAVTVSTAGAGNPIVSIIEDVVAIVASILAILLPIIAVLTFVLLAIFVYWSYARVRRYVRRTRSVSEPPATGS
jgi:hypothetical protein